ncbi:MAG TPA: hypothetical protein VHE60_15355 [Pyrinomonadaceae bacterium]|nr:hypothetical protein [Pyrinomonadaceae bacterium]
MKRKLFFTITAIGICLLFGPLNTRAQSADVPKYEVAADFASITFGPGHTELGLGGRFTYNLNEHVALEAAGYFFPRKCVFCARGNDGRITEGLFGVKVGKRFKKWGIFAKARPGVISFGDGKFDVVPITVNPPTGVGAFPFNFVTKRLTTFAMDVGGVLEFYPTRRIVTRIDFGDTLIHYGPYTNNFLTFDPTTGKGVLIRATTPSQTRGSVQFMAGVGFRF